MRTAKQIAQDLIVDLTSKVIDKIDIDLIIKTVRKEGYNPADVEGGQMVDAVTRQVVNLV